MKSSKGPKSKQLSEKEAAKIDQVTRSKGCGVAEAVKAVNLMREKADEPPIHVSSVYRYVNNETHQRGPEKRGAKPILSKLDKQKLERARIRLLKRVDNEKMVRYSEILEEAALDSDPCLRVVQDYFRTEQNVHMRHMRLHVGLSDKDAKRRFKVGKSWVKRPRSSWHKKTYLDCKAFPMHLTPPQRM